MKSFQNVKKGYASLQTNKCVHGRRSVKYIPKNRQELPNQGEFPYAKNHTQLVKQKESSNHDDAHSRMIKSLVAMNQEYFQQKLQVSNDGKPSNLKLKIPSQTGFTIYRRDYVKNAQDTQVNEKNNPVFKEKKTKVDFFGNTTYRNEFLGHQNQTPTKRTKFFQLSNSEGPSFLQTQYKHNFVNWGAESHMPSMKPHPAPAVTNLPFYTNTIYSSQFTAKQKHHTENGKLDIPLSQCNNGITLKNVKNPLLYKTTNTAYFDKKENQKENSMKPKYQTLSVGGNNFKGKSEYKSQFLNNKSTGCFQRVDKKSLNDLQNMILNL